MQQRAGFSLIVMGVAGCGKTTVGAQLAKRLDCPFIDADDYHPEKNVEKMSAGVPLSDDDRWPWLDVVRASIEELRWQHPCVVVACSALKASYRDRLSAGDPTSRFVYLQISPETAKMRLSRRRNHFMPAGLVESQFAALEEPVDAVVVEAKKSVDDIVVQVIAAIGYPPD